MRHNPKVILLMNFWYFFSISIWPYVRTHSHTRRQPHSDECSLQLWIRSIYIPDFISQFFFVLRLLRRRLVALFSCSCVCLCVVCAPEHFWNLNPDMSAKEQMNRTIYFVILLVRCAFCGFYCHYYMFGCFAPLRTPCSKANSHIHTHRTPHTISLRSLQSFVRLNLRFGNKYTKMPRNQNSTPSAGSSSQRMQHRM